jgi:hypothetical protein
MGNFYANVVARAERAEIMPLLSALRRSAFVGFFDGFAVVCDEECEKQDLDDLASLAATISARLSRGTVAVLNHDDDVLLFGLYLEGQLASEWGRSKMAGVPAPATSRQDFVKRVRQVMGTASVRRESPGGLLTRAIRRLFMVAEHELIAAELGLPAATVGSGFRYVERGDVPFAQKGDFERV